LGEHLAVMLVRRLRDPQRLRGEPHALCAQLARRQGHRVAADDGRAAGERADALRDAERVATDDADVVRGDAELVGGDLGQRGLEALALGRHAGEDGDAPRRIRANRRALEGAYAGQLDVAREADAEEAALLAGAPAFLREPIPA